MIFENSSSWINEPGTDGLLFMYQRIKEMLFAYTDNMYKVPVNNTVSLIQEFLSLASLAKKQDMDKANLSEVYSELKDTIYNDIVAKRQIGESEMSVIINKLDQSSFMDKEKIMRYLLSKLFNYGEYCIDYLKEVIPKENNKTKIEKILRCYIPHLINTGYSPRFIYYYNEKIFCNDEINADDKLEEFLNRFDYKRRKYIVYFALDNKSLKFKRILSERLGASFESDSYSKSLKYDRGNYYGAKFEIEALDNNGAVRNIVSSINIFKDCYSFLGNRKEKWFFEKVLVVENGDTTIIPIDDDIYKLSKDFSDKRLGEAAEITVLNLINHTRNSFPRIKRALEIHSTALNSQDKNSAFLNMWSILEIVGIVKTNQSKIKEIVSNVISIIENDYTYTVFAELHDYIKGNTNKDKLKNIIQSVEAKDDLHRIAYITVLDEYECKRQELTELLEKAPLIRSRMYKINKIFSSKKEYLKEIKRYSNRIRWHLLRIYRIRNLIIHLGIDFDKTRMVGEHLHGYVDEVMLSIIVRLSRNPELHSISNVLLEEEMIMNSIKKDYKKEVIIQKEDLCRLIDS